MGRPFTNFNFLVQLTLPGDGNAFICEAEFSECSGLEMSMEPKTIKEGGNNGRQIHLAGPVSYGQLTLKRGMTSDFGLWDWFDRVQEQPNLRASGEILMLSSDTRLPPDERGQVVFRLSGCLPVKLKAPSLNGRDAQVAVEEVQIAYERLSISRPAD